MSKYYENLKVRKSKGFTLIELMVTVATVAILAAIALPAYQTYVIRAQIAEGLLALGPVQLNISEAFLASGGVPAVSSSVDIINAEDKQSKYISGITASKTPGATFGEITLTFGNSAHAAISGRTLIFTPRATLTTNGGVSTAGYVSLETAGAGGKIDWGCNSNANVTATSRTLGSGNLAGTLGTISSNYVTSECK